MNLRIFNTRSGKIEEFTPIDPKSVTIYSCGPTVYDRPHLGNWSAYIYWDVLVRILQADGYRVKRVMNITDVGHLTSDADEGEDKMSKKARKESKTAWEIASFYADDFFKGYKKLNLIEPQEFVRATSCINEQLDLIRTLKKKGYTYQIDDGIYFDTSKFKRYADFAHLNLDELKAGARVEFNQGKKHSSDFALWKFSPANEKRDMEWQTPDDIYESGQEKMGFPGWHVECSAIAINNLGESIDIHTGGIDHIPIHHTNEIAQSEAATGKHFCNFWLHNNFIKINGTKISKSLGNGYTLDDIEEKGFSPMDFRMLILQGNYRNEGNFTFELLESAKNRLQKWKNVATLRHQIHGKDSSKEEIVPPYAVSSAIIEAINDDLGTPRALFLIDEAIGKILSCKLADINHDSLVELFTTIDLTLGLEILDSTPDISDDQKRLIIERGHYRRNKDWKKSDRIREQLETEGVLIRDIDNQSVWEYKS